MKVLQVCSYYRGEKLYENLFQALRKYQVESQVLYFASNTSNLEELPEDFIKSAVYNPQDRYVFHVKHNKVYEDIKNKVDDSYDILHAHSLVSNGFIAMKLSEQLGIPYITAVRNTDLNVFFRYMIHLRPLAREILYRSSGVIFLSSKYREALLEKYIPEEKREEIYQKSHIIGNGIEESFLQNLGTAKAGMKNNEIRLVFVSKKIDDFNKNIYRVIRVCESLKRKGYIPELNIIGKVKHPWFQKIFLEKEYIHIKGFLNHEQLREEYRNNDIFIMPSKRETFGLVYAEAMTQGLPVIYTQGQGFDGQFPEGTIGYHVSTNNTEEIVEKILKIRENYEEMSKQAIQSAMKFNWSSIAKEYEQIYGELKK